MKKITSDKLDHVYNDKYFFHGYIKGRDGLSRFAKGQNWGTFGSIGAAPHLGPFTKKISMKDVSG